ncbi:fibronectin type III domain-containing protein [Nonomuraea sp. C10]|uniref:fibronectin type III domain-containing protein n=1 Tax=Nonomuraea sp. C10 TaxID=2600577 RepID=UPI0011CD3F57|nr:fibronectin type III domain-containing protein [Nonomuraea sp. C10]TXK42856.1 fibronectin type III domain-containing protein [Nonomuraea sp. C10]
MQVADPQADVAASVYQWMLLTTPSETMITFAADSSAEQPSIALTYRLPQAPSKVLNLTAKAGDASAIASWGLPEDNGSMATIDGYDVAIVDGSGAASGDVKVTDPYVTIEGLTNGETYTVKVRARTAFGSGEWEETVVTPKAAPPPPSSEQECIPFLDTPPAGARAVADEVSGRQQFVERVKAYYEAQDAVLQGEAATIWQAPGVTARTPSTAKLSLLNTALVQERDALQEAGLVRRDSTVHLTDTVVRALPSGATEVTTKVTRSWREAPIAGMRGAAASTSPGQVEPSEPTINVHVFDRCGNMTVIQVALEVEEDSSDFFVTDGEAYLASKIPTDGLMPGSNARVALAPECTIVQSVDSTSDSKKLRLAKHLLVEVVGRSAWRVCIPKDSTTWKIDKFGAVISVYTDETFRKRAAKKGSTEKYTLDNSSADAISTPCFLVNVTSYQLAIQGSIAGPIPEGEVGGGVTFGQGKSENCPTQPGITGVVGGANKNVAFRSAMWWGEDALEARCWQSAGNTCSIQKYLQKTVGTFNWAASKGYKSSKNITASSAWRGKR